MSRMTSRVKPARARLRGAPKVGGLVNWLPTPPAASAAATDSSTTPMMVMTVPVTTGGKKRMNLAKNGAIRNATTPPMITAP